MKSRVAFLALILSSAYSFGQDSYKYDSSQGYSFIKKAERNLSIGKLDQSKKFILKARKSDFGGGNPEATAKSSINLIEAQILIRQKRYLDALALLDSTHGASFGVNCAERDSLKIVTLFLKYGKEKVRNSFKNLTVIPNGDSNQDDVTDCVFLKELNYNFCFYSDYERLGGEKINIGFREIANDRAFYKLLE